MFELEPLPSHLRNNRSALDRLDFVKKELGRLEQLGCISRVQHQPKIVNPISVVYSNKWRLVLDGSRGLNPFCKRRVIKLEDLSHLARTVSRGASWSSMTMTPVTGTCRWRRSTGPN